MFRFTIRDVLWLTLCVAMFFGGRYWNQVARLAYTAAHAACAKGTSLRLSKRRIRDRLDIHARSADCQRSSADLRHARYPDEVSVTAKAKGAAKVTVWEQGSGRQFTFDVFVDP